MPLIILTIQDNVASITLNRPEKFHAFNREMALELQQALDECAGDKAVRAIYLTGSGKAFCSGQDLGEVAGSDSPGLEKIVREHYNPIIKRMRNLPKPIVCAVNGVAAGAGANIALSGDVIIASAGASFIQAFSKIGLIPDSGGTYMLPRLVGFQKASALMMLGDKITAEEAERMGMIYKALPEEHFAEESYRIASWLAGMPTQALAYTKQALNASFHHTLEEQLQLEDELQSAAGKTQDYQEGIDAFLNKRTPVFKGL